VCTLCFGCPAPSAAATVLISFHNESFETVGPTGRFLQSSFSIISHIESNDEKTLGTSQIYVPALCII
jgi:hypothetical protein